MKTPTIALIASNLLPEPKLDNPPHAIRNAVAQARVLLQLCEETEPQRNARNALDDLPALARRLKELGATIRDLNASALIPLLQPCFEHEVLNPGSLGRKLALFTRTYPHLLRKRNITGSARYTYTPSTH